MTNTTYYTIEEWIRNHREIDRVEADGVVFLMKKNRIKFICGVGLVVVGGLFVPVPVPVGIPLIAFGCGLLGITTADLIRYKHTIKQNIKYKIKRWQNGL